MSNKSDPILDTFQNFLTKINNISVKNLSRKRNARGNGFIPIMSNGMRNTRGNVVIPMKKNSNRVPNERMPPRISSNRSSFMRGLVSAFSFSGGSKKNVKRRKSRRSH